MAPHQAGGRCRAEQVLRSARLARLIFESLQRYRRNHPKGRTLPTVLVLEEAHTFVRRGNDDDGPASSPTQLCREVFERIAREGRKYGLGLVLSSQRPSELSPTVLAQCNSFIVHRIQNPDDQEYFKSVISGINRELLDQLPALAQQQAIVLGDCVALPLQVRINTVSPRPRRTERTMTDRVTGPAYYFPSIEKA